jgi:hypothetical protein
MQASTGAWPWEWTPAQFDAWSAAHLRDGRTRATLRGCQNGVIAFCAFISDRRCHWDEVCSALFGAGMPRCSCTCSAGEPARTKTSGLDTDDYRRNKLTPGFGAYGALVVRNAKNFPGAAAAAPGS